MQITDLSVLVTGGVSGMGKAAAKWLTELGAKVTLVDLDDARVKSIADELNCQGIACDVTNTKSE